MQHFGRLDDPAHFAVAHRSIACLDLGLPHRLDFLTVLLGNQLSPPPPSAHTTKVRPLPWASLPGLGSGFLNRSVVFSFSSSHLQNEWQGWPGCVWGGGHWAQHHRHPGRSVSVLDRTGHAMGAGARRTLRWVSRDMGHEMRCGSANAVCVCLTHSLFGGVSIDFSDCAFCL
jgi:hypothetical protein